MHMSSHGDASSEVVARNVITFGHHEGKEIFTCRNGRVEIGKKRLIAIFGKQNHCIMLHV